jgi:elongator complex protein 3
MPGLFQNSKQDVKMFSQLFIDEKYMPDMLKIYPVLVLPNTKLFDLWKKGKFNSYTDENLKDFLLDFYPKVPYWNRIMRIQRDIPITRVSDGPRLSNMRELVLNELQKNKIKLKEIRARQLGVTKTKCDTYDIFVEKYKASKGTEYFISYESSNREQLVGFLRLRFPYKPFIKEIKNSALVRELHVYGRIVPVNEKSEQIGQHQGIGKLLLKTAEKIAKENNYKKISVIAGLGAREYYYKLGYARDKYYVSKDL